MWKGGANEVTVVGVGRNRGLASIYAAHLKRIFILDLEDEDEEEDEEGEDEDAEQGVEDEEEDEESEGD